MILTQYQAREKYGMSVTSLQRKAKKIPRPAYFIDFKEGAPRIDEDHPEFKMYVELLKRKQVLKEKSDNNTSVTKLINIVDKVITEEFGEKKANEIKFKIIEGLD